MSDPTPSRLEADGNDPYATKTPPVATPTSTGLRFRILRPHLKGGLGEVFIAHDEELPREVALKQIQERHADNPESRARFVLEAEVTGGLEHPGIVPVYGLGRYTDGRPFYAMRFIRGDNLKEAIKRFHENPASGGSHASASARNLEFRQLLHRFVDVCNAIAYAHSRKVLHRDLKPGNIMLGQYGETLVVDWGLAKVGSRPDSESCTVTREPSLRLKLGSDSAETQMGITIGTPGFMSPEQAVGRLDVLGPASDIYSLGATLYMILTGRPPITGEDVGTVLSRTCRGDFLPPTQAKAGVPKALDAICCQAMALKPENRYPSAQELAADIEHWLADEPVTAWREPWMDRARRWGRRHRTIATGLAAAMLVGLISLGVSALVLGEKNQQLELARRAEGERADGEERAKREALAAAQAEARANAKAQERLVEIQKGNDLLKSLLGDLKPGVERPHDKPLRAILGERIAGRAMQLGGTSVSSPLVMADLQDNLGESLLNLRMPGQAMPLLIAARAARENNLGKDHQDTLKSMHNLAAAYQDAEKFDLAIPLFQETLTLRKAKLGVDHPETLSTLSRLAGSYLSAGKPDAALPLYEDALKLSRAKLGPEHPDTLTNMDNLASGYRASDKPEKAMPLLEEILKSRRSKLGVEHLDTIAGMENLAGAYMDSWKPKLAEPLLEEVFRLKKVKLGEDHLDTLYSMSSVAELYDVLGKEDLALGLREECFKLMNAKLGSTDSDTLSEMSYLAQQYQRVGKQDRARPLFEDSFRLMKANLGADHSYTLWSMGNLAGYFRALGNQDRALALYEERLKLSEAKLGAVHPDTLQSMNDLASAYQDAGKFELSRLLFEKALQLSREKQGPDASRTLSLTAGLAKSYGALGQMDKALALFLEAQTATKKEGLRNYQAPIVDDVGIHLEQLGRNEEAEAWQKKWLAVVEETHGKESRAYAHALAGVGRNLLRQKKWAEAEAALRAAVVLGERKEPDAWKLFNTQSLLGQAFLGQKRYAEAERPLLAGYEGLKHRQARIPALDGILLTQSLERVVELFESTGRKSEAGKWRDELEQHRAAGKRNPHD